MTDEVREIVFRDGPLAGRVWRLKGQGPGYPTRLNATRDGKHAKGPRPDTITYVRSGLYDSRGRELWSLERREEKA